MAILPKLPIATHYEQKEQKKIRGCRVQSNNVRIIIVSSININPIHNSKINIMNKIEHEFNISDTVFVLNKNKIRLHQLK